MSSDINRVVIVGRLTRDAELQYTTGGIPILKISMASNTSRKQGDNWVDYGNFFDVALFGKRAESLAQYMTKGQQIAVEGQLQQERWEQDGMKRSKVGIKASDIQLLGGKRDKQGQASGQQSSGYRPEPQSPGMGRGPQQSAPQGGNDRFEDDIPF